MRCWCSLCDAWCDHDMSVHLPSRVFPPQFRTRWEGDGWAVVDPDGFEVDRIRSFHDAEAMAIDLSERAEVEQ